MVSIAVFMAPVTSRMKKTKHHPAWILIAGLLLAGGFIILKRKVPFYFAEAGLRLPAIEYVKDLQKSGGVDPKECAARYLYYQTDYHEKPPSRILISEKKLAENRVRVTLHDPSCQDDSVRESVNRIHLQRNSEGMWIPVLHEWSHAGRGGFGWTTRPTD